MNILMEELRGSRAGCRVLAEWQKCEVEFFECFGKDIELVKCQAAKH